MDYQVSDDFALVDVEAHWQYSIAGKGKPFHFENLGAKGDKLFNSYGTNFQGNNQDSELYTACQIAL